ncbi:beta-N-acetylhexosaminidase [Thalassotalea maritima]|uniref:beta-N-acetylhexosaminidase n=1 Tax=Thalassotalea maritima TaxID=3242416 RepID=UPI00352921D9
MSLLMIDVPGRELTAEDKELLAHPHVGGLILFSRNFDSVEQLCQLTAQIKAVNEHLLIAVDHEGGRVQRFRDGLSAIPAMGAIHRHSQSQLSNMSTPHYVLEHSKLLASAFGFLMASEVQACGIDISFAPVLDVDDISDVIGDRGFAKDPKVVTNLARAFIQGMNKAGMKATGKHFPGHGSVKEDSHIAMPRDMRSKAEIFQHDMQVFHSLIDEGALAAMMPAHVVYPDVDDKPVGFSRYWLQQVLRKSLGFNGVIFSDDLSMQGATSAGSFADRCEAAADAGCDMLLVCNDRQGAIEAINNANINADDTLATQRVQSMLNRNGRDWQRLRRDPHWQACRGKLFTC